MNKKLKIFTCYFLTFITLCLVLFGCKDKEENKNTFIVSNVSLSSYYVSLEKKDIISGGSLQKVMPILEGEVNIVNLGKGIIKNITFDIYIKTKAFYERTFTISFNDLSLGENQNLLKKFKTTTSIPGRIFEREHNIWSDYYYYTIDGYKLDEIIDICYIKENSVFAY